MESSGGIVQLRTNLRAGVYEKYRADHMTESTGTEKEAAPAPTTLASRIKDCHGCQQILNPSPTFPTISSACFVTGRNYSLYIDVQVGTAPVNMGSIGNNVKNKIRALSMEGWKQYSVTHPKGFIRGIGA